MDKIIVLMSTYNGEKYLREQIDSILAQEGVEAELLVRDDGSTDATQDILDEYQQAGKLTWYTGENLKPAGSFMDLIRHAGEATYYALSDQDDRWLPEKLARAAEKLGQMDPQKPALYYSGTILTDAELNPIPDERRGNKQLTLKQILIGSGATGCTMCFNRKLLELLRRPCRETKLMHDNWICKVCAVTGGKLVRDTESYILYRQHGGNTIGGFTQRHALKRHLHDIRAEKRYRSEAVAALYEAYRENIPEEDLKTVRCLAQYRKGLNRWRILADKGYSVGNKRNDQLFKIAILLGLF